MFHSDDYWADVTRIAAAIAMNNADYRERLFETTNCSDTMKRDIIGRIHIRKYEI